MFGKIYACPYCYIVNRTTLVRHNMAVDVTNAHRSCSISDVSSFSTVSVLSFDPVRMKALCVEEAPARMF